MAKKKGGNTVAEVSALVEPIISELGLSLWDVRYVKEGAVWYLRIFIDKEQGVTIEDCEKVTRAIDEPLDKLDPIEESYTLEVSSPGVNRVLKKPEHFKRFVQERVKVVLKVPLDGRGSFTGVIASADDDAFVLDDGTNQFRFAYNNIKKANLDPVLEF